MSLLSTVLFEMGLTLLGTKKIDAKNILPQTWTDFTTTFQPSKLKECKEELLKELRTDSNTIDEIWFNIQYLALYNSFNMKNHVKQSMDDDIVNAFMILLSRNASIIKKATFVIRMEWADISASIDKNKNKNRPQSPWGAIPSLSIPANPDLFQKHIWPNLSINININNDIKNYLNNNNDKITVLYLKLLDLVTISIYGLSRMDVQDKWMIRYYQLYGDIIISNNNNNNNNNNNSPVLCTLKTCLSYHRICIMMHLHAKWVDLNMQLMNNNNNNNSINISDDIKDDDDNDNDCELLKKYICNYLGNDFDSEIVCKDIYHIQSEHIDFWCKTNEKKILNKSSTNINDKYVANALEIATRFQDIHLFCKDLNETRANFCGEFICGLIASDDIKQIAKDAQKKNNKQKMKFPTLLPQSNNNIINNSDLNSLCINLHKNMFHGSYNLFEGLKIHQIRAKKMNPARLKKQQAAIRADLQLKLRKKMQAKMRQKTY